MEDPSENPDIYQIKTKIKKILDIIEGIKGPEQKYFWFIYLCLTYSKNLLYCPTHNHLFKGNMTNWKACVCDELFNRKNLMTLWENYKEKLQSPNIRLSKKMFTNILHYVSQIIQDGANLEIVIPSINMNRKMKIYDWDNNFASLGLDIQKLYFCPNESFTISPTSENKLKLNSDKDNSNYNNSMWEINVLVNKKTAKKYNLIENYNKINLSRLSELIEKIELI